MEDALASLPDDPAALKSIIATLTRRCDEASRRREQAQAENQRLQTRNQELEVQKLRLEVELLRLRKLYYGPRADRLASLGDVAQMLLAFGEELEDAAGRSTGPAAGRSTPPRPRRSAACGKGRRNLAAFDNLPVVRRVHDLPEDQKPCPGCGEARARIGAGSELAGRVRPGPLRTHRARPRQVRLPPLRTRRREPAHHAGRQAAPADREGHGRAGAAGVRRHRASSPTICRCTGWRRSSQRNGLCDRPRHAVRLVSRRGGPGQAAVRPDGESRAGVGRGRHRRHDHADAPAGQGQAGADVGLPRRRPQSRTTCSTSPSAAAATGRLRSSRTTSGRCSPTATAGTTGSWSASGITRAGCWAHARRKFVEAEKTHPQIAAEAVGLIKRLYAVEERAKALGRRRSVVAAPKRVGPRADGVQGEAPPLA